MSIDEEIQVIKARIQAGHLAKARSEAVREAAQETESKALADLREKFGLDNLEDVHAKLAELQDELNNQMKRLNETLDGLNI